MNNHVVRAHAESDKNRQLFTVGTPVHVIVHHNILPGVVVEVGRCIVREDGVPIQYPTGDCPYFVAEYVDYYDDAHRCAQAYQSDWFADLDDARRVLRARLAGDVRRLRDRIKMLEMTIDELNLELGE